MNFGTNLYNWFLPNAQSLALAVIAFLGVWFGIKREFSKLAVTLLVAVLVVLFTFNPSGVKGVLLNFGNKLIK